MQNWNQWQLPAAPVTVPMPQPPIGYAAPGADPMATMQSYMQYYNQPAPSGYTAEQWAAAQQQNWAQWQTWQQQYQQWQAQYGEKYQETMKQMSNQNLSSLGHMSSTSNVQPPPLPKEDSSAKPPLPPESNTFGFPGIPPPHQNNLPLFPSSKTANPPLPPGQPPLPPGNSHNSSIDNNSSAKRVASSNVETVSAKKLKVEDDEPTEAEKLFDARFKKWEAQFNAWKQQNANHPDKIQYKQYEAKWTSCRENLIERREQMRRKRKQQKQAAAKAEAEKEKSLVGDDKILNILSSTENQGLINNLLGIGKTLGLTGKNEGIEEKVSTIQPPVAAVPSSAAAGISTMTSSMNPATWATQQWTAQYNAGMNMTNYTPGYQQPSAIPQLPTNPLSTTMTMPNFNQPPANFNQPTANFYQPPVNFTQPPGNFNQPPPNMLGPNQNFLAAPPNMSSSVPNFSQPPPGFGTSNSQQQTDSSQRSEKGYSQDQSTRSFRSDGEQRESLKTETSSRDSTGLGKDRYSFEANRFSGPPPSDLGSMNRIGEFGLNEPFRRDGSNKDFASGNQLGSGSDINRRDDSGRDFSPGGRNNEFRPNDRFGNDGDRFGSGFDKSSHDGDNQDNRGENRSGSERDSFNPDRFGSNNDRFNPNNDRFNTNNDRFNTSGDRFSSGNDRFGSGNDRFGLNNSRFGSSSNDQFKPDNDRFGSSNDRFRPGNDQFGSTPGDRFGSSIDRPSMSNFGQLNDKFSRPPPDRFEPRDGIRDSGGSNSRGFGKSNQFDPPMDMPPELQKLMEKRKAAIDVFKPSNFSSLLDSDKNSSSSTSLSESFRKITGDSPFLSRSSMDFSKKDNNAGLRGPPVGPLGSNRTGNFESSRDLRSDDTTGFKFRGIGDFRPQGGGGDFPLRGMAGFGSRGNEFAPRESGDFLSRGNESGSRDSKDFGARGNEFGPRGFDTSAAGGPRRLGDFGQRIGNEFGPRSGNEFETPTKNEQQKKQQNESFGSSDMQTSTPDNSEKMTASHPIARDSPMHTVDERKGNEESSKGSLLDPAKIDEEVNPQNVPPLEMPPWMESEFPSDDISEVPVDKPIENSNAVSTDLSKDNSQPPANSESLKSSVKESEDRLKDNENKPDTLPFMGENDPKPVDLNMEPPPELPNLGPIIKDSELHSESKRPNMSSTFDHPSGDRQKNVDAPFDSMQTKSKGANPFEIRSQDDSRPQSFGPEDVGGGPQESMRPPSGPFGLHCSNNEVPFGPRGPQLDSFKPDGPFGARGSGDVGSRDPGDFGPRGPSAFGPRGPGDFGSHGPGDYGPRGPSVFGPRGPGDFGPRGPGDFGPRGPGDFGPRGPGDFGPRGPGDFGPRGPGDFGPRGPGEFGPRGFGDFGTRGPSAFGPRGPGDFGPRGPSDFGPRDTNERPFGPRGMSSFGPRGPLDRSFGPGGPNDPSFSAKPSGTTGIPSLMSFKFDRPIDLKDDNSAQKSDEFEPNRCNDLPPAFRKVDQDQRPFCGNESEIDRNILDQGSGGSDWRESFDRNKFGDSDQRTGPVNFDEQSAMRSGNQMPMDRDRSLPGPSSDKKTDQSHFTSDERMKSVDGASKSKSQMMGPRFDESSGSANDNERSGDSTFVSKRSNESRANEGQKEFCIEKQFNYNHGGGMPDEISKDHTPKNVIDYGHAPRVIEHDYVTPVQCYDYGHGSLKPIVSEHEIHSKKDFKNWVENEQNLRDYTDRMRTYESEMRALKCAFNQRHSDSSQQFRERNRSHDDTRSFDHNRRPISNRNDRNRRDRETNDYRDRERRSKSRERGRIERDREWERASSKHHEDRSQHRRSKSKDRTREKPEKIRQEAIKENKKDDERSKGNVADSESSAKKPDESTSPDNSKQESKDGEPDATPNITEVTKTVEIPKTMELPTTMELPKTPNFTMVDDLLCQPGRQNRPPKIVVILRGPPGSGKSFVAKLIKDKEVEQGGSAPRILSLDDYFLTEKEVESEDNNGKKVTTKDMVYEYEEAMEPSYITSLVKAFKKNITDGFFNFIILDSINEKISDYEEMWSFAKTKGFRVYVCEMEMDVQICLKRNIHKRTEDEINRIVDYFEPTPGYHQKLDVTSMLQEEAIEEVHMEDTQEEQEEPEPVNEDSQDSQEEPQDSAGVSKWERMEAEDKLDRLDGLAKRKNEGKPQTMEDFLQVPDYYDTKDTSGKKRVRWADLEERKKQEKMREVGFVVGQTNWDRMMDPTKGGSALTRTKYI